MFFNDDWRSTFERRVEVEIPKGYIHGVCILVDIIQMKTVKKEKK